MEYEDICIYSDGEILSRVVLGQEAASADDDFNTIWSRIPSGAPVYAVIDRNACSMSPFVAGFAEFLLGKQAAIHEIDATEQTKNMDTVLGICSWLMDCGADRNALLIAIGGGITTDMAGFAASIYKRGIRFAYVPTTLLAQVDASVGGKTGVNLDRYKNMLGVIRQPEFTFLSARALGTLASRDFLSGASEMLKSFIIEDGGNYRRAVEMLGKLHLGRRHGGGIEKCSRGEDIAKCNDGASEMSTALEHDLLCFASKTLESNVMPQLQALIAAAVKVKAGIVSRDQFESGERRKLNLGHTFAHAIETLARRRDMDVTHGEAVAMGIVLAARLSVRLGEAPSGTDVQVMADLESCGLPVCCPFSIAEMSSVMLKDKKAEGGKVHFVLMHGIGDVFVRELTVDEAVAALAD